MKTLVTLLVDTSGSMAHLAGELTLATNGVAKKIAHEAIESGHHYDLELYEFNGSVRRLRDAADARTFDPLPRLYCDGGTALYEAIIRGIGCRPRGYDAHLIQLITDGEQCPTAGDYGVRYAIAHAPEDTTLAAQVPSARGLDILVLLGFPRDNIEVWTPTERGTHEAGVSTRSAITRYAAARSRGAKRVDNFYVNTDASKVTPRKLAAKLHDATGQFDEYTVPMESRIDEFTKRKTRRNYVVGQTYYELMKSETVHPEKDVLIQDKSTARVYAGPAARDLISLPTDRTAKVTPGNHANYTIYVQSRSINRRLPRGTKVLIDPSRKRDATSTWDHTQVTQ